MKKKIEFLIFRFDFDHSVWDEEQGEFFDLNRFLRNEYHTDYSLFQIFLLNIDDDKQIAYDIFYKKGSFPFKASGRARASNESDGMIKVFAHKDTDEILGVHMIGPRCADMIAEAVLAMEFRASAEDVARTCHAHPTYTEVFKEACLAATEDRAIHI